MVDRGPELSSELVRLLGSPLSEERREGILQVVNRRLRSGITHLDRIAASDPANDLRIVAFKGANFLRDQFLEKPSPAVDPAEDDPIVHLGDPDPAHRNQAIVTLGRRHLHELFSTLFALVDTEKDPMVRASLARALAQSVDLSHRGRLIGVLVGRFLADDDPRVRVGALEAFGVMDGREAAEAVLERLSDGDRGCRVAAAELVRQWGLETLLTAGRSLLLRPSTRARLTAVTALALFPRPEVVGLLEWALCDPEPDVAGLARQTLEKMVEMGQRGAGEALERAAEQAPLIALASGAPTDMPPTDPLDSPAPFWRINEIIRITKVDDRTRICDLLDRLPRERDPFVTATLVNALARLEAKQAVPFLRSYLASGDSRVRANTVEAVGRLGTPEDRALLARFFKDANNRVRANAVVACHGLPGVDVRPVLVEMLASEDVWMRKSALYAIRALGDPELARLLNPSERADTAAPAS